MRSIEAAQTHMQGGSLRRRRRITVIVCQRDPDRIPHHGRTENACVVLVMADHLPGTGSRLIPQLAGQRHHAIVTSKVSQRGAPVTEYQRMPHMRRQRPRKKVLQKRALRLHVAP